MFYLILMIFNFILILILISIFILFVVGLIIFIIHLFHFLIFIIFYHNILFFTHLLSPIFVIFSLPFIIIILLHYCTFHKTRVIFGHFIFLVAWKFSTRFTNRKVISYKSFVSINRIAARWTFCWVFEIIGVKCTRIFIPDGFSISPSWGWFFVFLFLFWLLLFFVLAFLTFYCLNFLYFFIWCIFLRTKLF